MAVKKKPQQQSSAPMTGSSLITPVASQVGYDYLTAAPAAAEAIPSGFVQVGTNIDGSAMLAADTGGFMASAAPWLGAAAALHGGYNLATHFGEQSALSGGLSGAETGAGIGTMILPGVGTAIGAGIGAVAGTALSAFHKSGKGRDQKQRDAVRANLQKGGVIDDKYRLGLSDGSSYDIGKDGKEKLYNFDPNSTDYTNQTAAYNIPLSYLAGGGDQKLASDFTGYFTNAALSNAKDAASAKENVKAIASKFGDVSQIKNSLKQLYDDKKLDQAKYDAALNGVDSLFDIGAYGKGQSSGASGPSKKSYKKPVVVAAPVQDEIPLKPVFLPKPGTPSQMPGDIGPYPGSSYAAQLARITKQVRGY